MKGQNILGCSGRLGQHAIACAALWLGVLAIPANAQTFMTQTELLATIPGHTIHGVSRKGKAFVQVYSKGGKRGTVAGKMGNSKYTEAWFVTGNFWCESWASGHVCWQVVRKDRTTLQMYRAGRPIAHLWKVE